MKLLQFLCYVGFLVAGSVLGTFFRFLSVCSVERQLETLTRKESEEHNVKVRLFGVFFQANTNYFD